MDGVDLVVREVGPVIRSVVVSKHYCCLIKKKNE